MRWQVAMVVRVLVQQAATATLVLPGGEVVAVGGEGEDQPMVCFVCFLKEATEEGARKAARAVVGVKLTEAEEGQRRVALTATSSKVWCRCWEVQGVAGR